MNERAGSSISSSLILLAALSLACGPDGPRPCRGDDPCEGGETCVLDSDDEVGVCAAAVVDGDAGVPRADGGPADGGDRDPGTPDEDGGMAGDGGSHDAGPPRMAINDVTVGGGFACVRTFGHEAYCLGDNSNGQLGNTDTTLDVIRPLTRVNGLSEVRDVAAANDHACALGAVGGEDGIYCWGSSSDGQLGLPAGQAAGIPHRVNVPDGVHDSASQVQTGTASTCVLTSDDEVWCWGPGVPGYTAGAPLHIDVFDGAVRLHVSDAAICAKLQTGVRCLDQTGLVQNICTSGIGARECDPLDDALGFHFTPSNVCRLEGSDRVGSLSCAGDNDFGVAIPGLPGDLAVDFSNLDPGFSTAKIALGSQHACALGNDSRVRCWGRNLRSSTGQAETFGEPCSTDALCHEPLKVPDVPNATDLDAFGSLSCAVADDGAVWCWGELGGTTIEPARYAIPD